MNAPDFNFGHERRDRGLPASIVRGGRDMASAMAPIPAIGSSSESTAAEPEGLNLRDEFFKLVGLVIKHRWLVLACCLIGLFTGFIVTFTTTPIYRATAIIKIDPEAARVVKLETVDSGQVGDIGVMCRQDNQRLPCWSRVPIDGPAGDRLLKRSHDVIQKVGPPGFC